jgi:guanosine-3',5'-bis(diphosphate) 3'-pyrophosphohydrolase
MIEDNFQEANFELCEYSSRLLDKISLLNTKAQSKVDLLEIKKAIYYARKYHAGQMRQSGEPYYSHPLEVAYLVADYLFKTDILVTCIMHDTIEDTKMTKEIIESIFGHTVASQVIDLTRIKGNQKISSAELVELLWSQKKYDLLLVKQFDRLHNMLTIKAKSPEKIKKITEETISTFIVLAAYLGIRDIEDKLVKLCSVLTKEKTQFNNSELPYGNDEHLLSLVLQNDIERK